MDEEAPAAAHQLLQLQDAAALTIQRCWRGDAVRTAVIEALTSQLQQQQDADDALEQQQQHTPTLRVLMTPQQALVQEWSAFAARQAARYVRAPPSAGRRRLPQPVCYRLRILGVSGVPQPQCGSSSQGAASQCYELQLGVSLFDESLGVFYGSTVLSAAEPLPTAAARDAAAVAFDYNVFFHSEISDPRCMAVVSCGACQALPGGAASLGWGIGGRVSACTHHTPACPALHRSS